ncbi:hypothetical protein H8F21_13600 [Pseudomonas sp. P66]|uniref:Uncharacterized protein n=1 Tax=Pseudomonas arcuscaelestis TaxID=2710591 RepID=A0ABS2C0N4_9PSED|nr:hypothetical protein [Pseudomonas arcuscaelestis]MBM5458599.1 hypothetical protein [Pseudomonas arcuscaelestis]
MNGVALLAMFATSAALGWVKYKSSLDQYPNDMWWWEGSVGENTVALDGDQDLLTSDGFFLVLDGGPELKPGDSFYVLHATNDHSQGMTYHCASRDRDRCYPISQVITFPMDTFTLNQGLVAAKPASQSHIDYVQQVVESTGHSSSSRS